jgi:hypothetical protein
VVSTMLLERENYRDMPPLSSVYIFDESVIRSELPFSIVTLWQPVML